MTDRKELPEIDEFSESLDLALNEKVSFLWYSIIESHAQPLFAEIERIQGAAMKAANAFYLEKQVSEQREKEIERLKAENKMLHKDLGHTMWEKESE